MNQFPIEVEGKYRVADARLLSQRLDQVQAEFVGEERHSDTYLSHPCRDFRITDEALRIRMVDGTPFVTYKGPRMEGALKTRQEFEFPLGDSGADKWMQILKALGFHEVRTVSKTRRNYRVAMDERRVTVTLDHVDGIGCFVEIEQVVHSDSELELARSDIEMTAIQLGLDHVEKRSYLSMLLELDR